MHFAPGAGAHLNGSLEAPYLAVAAPGRWKAAVISGPASGSTDTVRTRILYCALLVPAMTNCHAQLRNVNWLFGAEQWISFNGGSPTKAR
jgi:hypothetical protein